MRVKERNGSHTIYTDAQISAIVNACQTELAMNFDIPSRTIISSYAAKLNVTFEVFRKMLADAID